MGSLIFEYGEPALNVLFITTKPPWPAVDGGRLLVHHTLERLAGAGHRVTLVCPAIHGGADAAAALERWCRPCLVPARPRPLLLSLVLSQVYGRALSVTRHALGPVRREAERLFREEAFDVVHVEQLQALAQSPLVTGNGDVPVVLRAQNVESDLYRAVGAAQRGPTALLARRESRRLAADEGRAVAHVRRTVALTREDAERLGELAGGRGRIRVVRAPFAGTLPPGDVPLAGRPAVVVMGSEGWLPNRDAVEWFHGAVWPKVRDALPEARLHVYGHRPLPGATGVDWYGPPEDSRQVFAPGSILAVPLRIGSGVRMKILEAWARGVPVVATHVAIRGLEAVDGRDVLVADDAGAFGRALRRLAEEPGLAGALVEGGRRTLAERHDPEKVTADLLEVYADARREDG